jgi:hypothetical protein
MKLSVREKAGWRDRRENYLACRGRVQREGEVIH